MYTGIVLISLHVRWCCGCFYAIAVFVTSKFLIWKLLINFKKQSFYWKNIKIFRIFVFDDFFVNVFLELFAIILKLGWNATKFIFSTINKLLKEHWLKLQINWFSSVLWKTTNKDGWLFQREIDDFKIVFNWINHQCWIEMDIFLVCIIRHSHCAGFFNYQVIKLKIEFILYFEINYLYFVCNCRSRQSNSRLGIKSNRIYVLNDKQQVRKTLGDRVNKNCFKYTKSEGKKGWKAIFLKAESN